MTLVAGGLGAVVLPWALLARDWSTRQPERVAERWEAGLLLQAAHYLDLTPRQAQELLPLALEAQQCLDRRRAEDRRALAAIHTIAAGQDAALRLGQPADSRERAAAVEHWRGIEERRVALKSALTEETSRRLAAVLDGEQVRNASRLATGMATPQETGGPALLEPRAGFVVPTNRPAAWTDGAFTPLNSLRIGSDGRIQPDDLGVVYAGYDRVCIDAGDSTSGLMILRARPAPRSPGYYFTVDVLAPMRGEYGSVSEAEEALILQPMARRLFLSPQWPAVLRMVADRQ